MLRKKRMDLHLVVYDAARPRSIQQHMWKVADCTGHPLPIGSEYDYFGERSRVDLEYKLIQNGEITPRELSNRQLLREIMTEAGWLIEPSEWWHFNAMPLTEASGKLTVIE